jgi:hypothetical protein
MLLMRACLRLPEVPTVTFLNILKLFSTDIMPRSLLKAKLSDGDIDEDLLYAVMKTYVLTPQQLEDNGFPLPDPQV